MKWDGMLTSFSLHKNNGNNANNKIKSMRYWLNKKITNEMRTKYLQLKTVKYKYILNTS